MPGDLEQGSGWREETPIRWSGWGLQRLAVQSMPAKDSRFYSDR